MTWDKIESNWEQLKDSVKYKWDKLTDDDIHTVKGNRTALSGKIQSTYGLTEQDAHKQVSDWESMLGNVFKSDQRIVKESGAKPLPDDED